MRKMKAVEVGEPKGPLQLVQRDVPSPGTGQVLIKVQACGICHSDLFTKEGLWPGLQYPRVPGHEIAGIIDTAGPGVEEWKPGQRVGAWRTLRPLRTVPPRRFCSLRTRTGAGNQL